MNHYLLFIGMTILMASCGGSKSAKNIDQEQLAEFTSHYEGTASITQGLAKTTEEHIYECEGGRKTDIGLIRSTDGKQWTMPASNNFKNEKFPFSSDLYNSCNGNTYANAQEAISKLDGSDIIEIDPNGELFTAYIFGDNYFEMYVNGIPVGKDKIPFTPFNSSIIRFKASKPYTIAMKLVDWEESLGIGSEGSRGNAFHSGDGGMVAVIKDIDNNTVATTNEGWKAQTFYTAPIKDLSCVTETGLIRTSNDCDQTDSNDGTSYFGLHWELPSAWAKEDFDDSNWPNAITYSNKTIGVDNKKAYTNFIEIFDDQTDDAKFIWSSNVVLDNEVIVRTIVK